MLHVNAALNLLHPLAGPKLFARLRHRAIISKPTQAMRRIAAVGDPSSIGNELGIAGQHLVFVVFTWHVQVFPGI